MGTAIGHRARHQYHQGLVFALLGAVLFSGKAIIIKLAYRHGADAVTLVFLRMVMAFPLFLVLAWWAGRGRAPLQGRDHAVILGLGFSGYYLASLLDFMGLAYISASLERLILYLNPTLVLLLGWLFWRRPVRRQHILSLALSYLGVVLVFGQELHLDGPHVLKGAALVLGSALSYALYLIFSGEEVKRLGALRLTGWASSVACLLCMLHFGVFGAEGALSQVNREVLGLSLLNALACTFAPVLLVMLGVERIGASAAAQASLVGPMSTILLGVWLLDEPFTPVLGVGTALVLSGVAWLGRQRPS